MNLNRLRLFLLCFCFCIFGGFFISMSSGAVLSSDTQSFLNSHPGVFPTYANNRLVALSGATMATDSDTNTTTQEFVDYFLFDPVNGYKDALGVDNLVLDTTPIMNECATGAKVFIYTQKIDDLPVLGSRVTIPVLLGSTEKIFHIGITLVQPPAALSFPDDVITDSAAAVNIVDNDPAYDHLTYFSSAEEYIVKDSDGIFHRAWMFVGENDDESNWFFVDAISSEIIEEHDRALNADIEGKVTGWATPSPSADNPDHELNCPIEMDMPGIELKIEGFPAIPTNDDGTYTYTGLADETSYTINTSLIGDWVEVIDKRGTTYELKESISHTALVSPITDADIVFNVDWNTCSGRIDDDVMKTAQMNAFITVQRTHDWFRNLLPSGYNNIDKRVKAVVNKTEGFPAQFIPSETEGESKLVFSQSVTMGCGGSNLTNNWAAPDIIAHEYGHFILHSMGFWPAQSGGLDIEDQRRIGAFQEGSADVVMALMLGTTCQGLDLCRTGDPAHCHLEFDVGQSVEGIGQSHIRGRAISGAFWNTREELIATFQNDPDPEASAKAVIDPLFAKFLCYTSGILDQRVLSEVLAAADDDPDTPQIPYATEIIAGFTQHGWVAPPCDATDGLIVEWDVSGTPQPGTDYSVFSVLTSDGCLPEIQLHTTEVDVLGIMVPVTKWNIGREVNNVAASIRAVGTDWDSASTALGIEVVVGDPLIAQVGGVHEIIVDSQRDAQDDPSNWTSIRLGLEGDLNGMVKPETYNGSGGRVSGSVDGSSSFLTDIRAVELGEGAGGGVEDKTLEVKKEFNGNITLDKHPSGNTLTLGRNNGTSTGRIDIKDTVTDVGGIIRIKGTFDGTICAKGITLADVSVDVYGLNAKIFNNPEYTSDPCSIDILDVANNTPGAPLEEDETERFSKNRYLAFKPETFIPGTSNLGTNRIRVQLVSLHHPPAIPSVTPPDYSALEGEFRWVGQPQEYCEGGACTTMFWGAALQCDPVDIVWNDLTNWPPLNDTLYVYGADVVPSSLYEVQTIVNLYPSSIITVETALWGDVVAPFNPPSISSQPNLADVLAIADKWLGAVDPIKSRAQLQGNVFDPNQSVGIADVLKCVDAWLGVAYPFNDPQTCP